MLICGWVPHLSLVFFRPTLERSETRKKVNQFINFWSNFERKFFLRSSFRCLDYDNHEHIHQIHLVSL